VIVTVILSPSMPGARWSHPARSVEGVKRKEKPEVYSITRARTSRSDDVDQRTKRYLFSMGIRAVCFVGAVVAHGPLRWVLLAAALLLPYVAVVVANTARSTVSGRGPEEVTLQEAPRLEPGEHRPPAS